MASNKGYKKPLELLPLFLELQTFLGIEPWEANDLEVQNSHIYRLTFIC